MSSHSEPTPRASLRLTDLAAGETGRVCALEGEANFCARLREMGICESAVIEKIHGSHTLLCQLCGTRIALSGSAAKHIVVEKLPDQG
ncbi:MAG: ferrous iron transport protein A [Opitutae bacterium]|nr:ferrous iron transport protein A [Opitutae bacterium]